MRAAAAPPSPALGAGAALVLAGIVLAAFNLRTAVTSITPLLDVLGREFGFGAGMAGVLGMLPSAAFALFGVATPAIAHRIGLERTVLVAMLLAAVGLALRSFAPDTVVLVVGSAVAFAGAGIGNVVLPPLVKRYFPTRIGVVSTLYIAVLQTGTILPALVAVPIAAEAGWRISLGAWAVVAAAAVLPWIGVLWVEQRGRSALARAHDRAVLPGDAAPELATSGPRVRAWRTAIGWGMALMFGMTSLMTYAVFTWLPRLMTDAGASPAFGGAMLALFSGIGLLGALVMPTIAVSMRNPFAIVLACVASQLAAYVGLLTAPMAMPMLWVSLLGVGGCTFPLALTLLNKRTRTPAGSAALSGFTQGMGYMLACLGPLLFGLLHEKTGGWTWPFAMLAASAVVLLLGAWQACKPRYLEDA